VKAAIGPIGSDVVRDPSALPQEWSVWAEEPGLAVRVEEDGLLRGCIHVVVVGQGEGWLEGLWVDPAVRGSGLGRRLVAESFALVRRHGATVVRAAIPAHASGALTLAERIGFSRYCEAVVLLTGLPDWPSDLPTAVLRPSLRAEATTVAGVKEAATIARLLAESAVVQAWHGLVPLGWRFRRLVPELVKGLIKDRRVLRAGGGHEGAALYALRGEWAVISALAGSREHSQALVGGVIEEARRAGASRLALFVPDASAIDGLGTVFEPHPWCPDGLVIVQKTLAGG
jgi:GNAT superfamily N-acetyltransferase